MSALSDKCKELAAAMALVENLENTKIDLDRRLADARSARDLVKESLDEVFRDVDVQQMIVPLDPGAAMWLDWNSTARGYLYAKIVPLDQDASFVVVDKVFAEAAVAPLPPVDLTK